MKAKSKSRKTKSIGDKPASKITFKEDLVARLFLDVTSRFFTGRYDLNCISQPAPEHALAHRIVASVDELICELDNLAESKAIESIAENIVNSPDSQNEKEKPATPGLKFPDIETKYICDKVDVIRYKAPADPTDDDAGLEFILVHFYLRSGGNRGGVKFKIEDKWGTNVNVIAIIGNRELKTALEKKTALFTTTSTWKAVKLKKIKELGVKVYEPNKRMEEQSFATPTEVMEFDAP